MDDYGDMIPTTLQTPVSEIKGYVDFMDVKQKIYQWLFSFFPYPKIFTTLKEIWNKADASKLNNDVNRENRSRRRGSSTYLYTGFSKMWREKIYNTIKKFVNPRALPGYVLECPIIGSQT